MESACSSELSESVEKDGESWYFAYGSNMGSHTLEKRRRIVYALYLFIKI